MQIAEHIDDGGGKVRSGFVGGGHFGYFAHYGMDHQIRGVGFNHIGCGAGADDVGLFNLSLGGKRIRGEESSTRSAPGEIG